MNNPFDSLPSLKLFAVAASLFAMGSTGCAGVPVTDLPHAATPVVLECERPLVVRAEAGSIWAGYRVYSEPHRAWVLPARGPVEGLVLREIAHDGGYEVLFRQGGVSWVGKLDADQRIVGELQAVSAPDEKPADDSAVATR